MPTETIDSRVRLPKLNGDNYRQWSISLRAHLRALRLWYVVRPIGDAGSSETPARSIEDHQADASRASPATSVATNASSPSSIPASKTPEDIDADDASAISILLGTVDDVQFQHIGDIESAREMWATLKRIHNAPSRHKLASLLRQ